MSAPETGIDYLSVDDLLDIAAGILDRVDVREPGLLASAAARPASSVFGSEAYPVFAEKLAALMHSLARNHPLLDGNKRLAWSAGRVFCLMNSHDLRIDIDEAEEIMLGVAAGELDVPELAVIIGHHLTTS